MIFTIYFPPPKVAGYESTPNIIADIKTTHHHLLTRMHALASLP